MTETLGGPRSAKRASVGGQDNGAESTEAVLTLLGRAAILATADLETEDVAVPEWGGTVRVTAMSATERDAFEESCVSQPDANGDTRFVRSNIRAKLCARTMVGSDGKRLFTDADILTLGQKSAAALDRVFAVAMRLSNALLRRFHAKQSSNRRRVS